MRGVLAVALVLVAAAGAAWLAARASLPRQTGALRLAGLAAPVEVRRDALGVPVLRGESLVDLARALGFIHAQERFFQMDLARRAAAGEVSALMGAGALQIDRDARPLRFRSVARRVIEGLPPGHRAQIEAYTEGVNAGLADLGARPPEYLLLGAAPEAWKPEDCALTLFLMYRFLNYTADNEKRAGLMRDTLPRELADFLTPEVSRWDAPIAPREAAAEADAMRPMPVPGPEVIDLRGRAAAERDATAEPSPRERLASLFGAGELGASYGSNNWAVAGSRTVHGGAIVNNDMHLDIGAPNTWFRAQIEWPGRRAVGVTLPGVPGIVCGSTGVIAWGFTNVEADVQDLILIEVDPADPARYRTPDGWEKFGEEAQTIAVRGGKAETATLRTTRWGVVSDTDHKGRPLVLRWTALDPEKVNFRLFDLLEAGTLEEAVATARAAGIPAQNVVIADAHGRVGYVVAGWLPRRVGPADFDGKAPRSWAEAGVGWEGQIADGDRPAVIDPADGLLWTANNRVAGWPESRKAGTSWSPPVRAHRIRELLRAGAKWDEAGLAGVALDARARAMDPFRDIVLEVIGGSESDAGLRAARALAEGWDGTAGADQTGYRFLRAFAADVERAVFAPLVAPCVKADPKFVYRWSLREEPLLRILEARPEHLLPPAPKDEWKDWAGFLRATAGSTVRRMQGAKPPTFGKPWGEFMRLRAQHPISRGVPLLGWLLDLPSEPLPGDASTVRAQGQTFGASERFAVSPGKEERGVFHMPGGQSGHFLSPHYADGHAAWVSGEMTGMLSGAAVKQMMLMP